jgi:hypothetical protein
MVDATIATLEEWPPERQKLLDALTESLSYAAASERIGIHRATAWRWRQDPTFAAACEQAQQWALDKLEASGYQRALAGSDLLTMFYIKRWRPEYRDKQDINLTANVHNSYTLNLPQDPEARRQILTLAAQRYIDVEATGDTASDPDAPDPGHPPTDPGDPPSGTTSLPALVPPQKRPRAT